MAGGGLVRTVQPVRVRLPGKDAFDPHVPDITGTIADGVEIDAARWLGVGAVGEQFQPDTPGVATEEREVDPVHEGASAQGQREPAPDVRRFSDFVQVFR